MEKLGAEVLYSAVNSVMRAKQTKDEEAQQDAALRMIHRAKHWNIRTLRESKLVNGKPLVPKTKENPNLIDLNWTQDERAKLGTIVKIFLSLGASGPWRVD
jgi:hypothetical protein